MSFYYKRMKLYTGTFCHCTTELCEDEMSDTDYTHEITTMITQLATQFSQTSSVADLEVFRDTATK